MLKKKSLIIGLVVLILITIVLIVIYIPKRPNLSSYGMGVIPEKDHLPQCLNGTTTLANGRISYPNDYPNLPFLGQLFTSFKCTNSLRQFQMPGVNTKNVTYGPGIKIWLYNPASGNLLQVLKRIGFNCSEQLSDDTCKVWQADKEIKLWDIEDLERYAAEIKTDDCLKCS